MPIYTSSRHVATSSSTPEGAIWIAKFVCIWCWTGSMQCNASLFSENSCPLTAFLKRTCNKKKKIHHF